MRKRKQALSMLLAALMAVWAHPARAFAAPKIRAVSLVIESSLAEGKEYSAGDIEVTAKGGRYSVEEIEILNEDGVWDKGDIPKIKITLHADEGYDFDVDQNRIRIENGTYQSSVKKDVGSLSVTVRLPSLLETIGEFTGAGWISNHEAAWNEVGNAGHYEVLLFRDGKSLGTIGQTAQPRIDFGNQMVREGSYSFKVRAVNMRRPDVKTEWVEGGGSVWIDQATARQMRSQHGGDVCPEAEEPGQAIRQSSASDPYGWIHDNGGWWYRNPDGTYTAANWQRIHEKWYYFNSAGYLVTGWIDWNGKSYYCDPETGEMLVSAMVPDGSGQRVDSTGAWIE